MRIFFRWRSHADEQLTKSRNRTWSLLFFPGRQWRDASCCHGVCAANYTCQPWRDKAITDTPLAKFNSGINILAIGRIKCINTFDLLALKRCANEHKSLFLYLTFTSIRFFPEFAIGEIGCVHQALPLRANPRGAMLLYDQPRD